MRFFPSKILGFTLAELLIALGILGIIATFTIPKVLSAQQASKYSSIAKEMLSALSDAHQSHKLSGSLSSATTADDIVAYLNYVKVDSVTLVDDAPGDGTISCANVSRRCYLLHSGAMLVTTVGQSYGGTTNDKIVQFVIDPDGESSSVLGLDLFLRYTGQMQTRDVVPDATVSNSGGVVTPTGSSVYIPSWFSW